jgi:hypothetical protein
MGIPRRVSLNSAFYAPLVCTIVPTGQTDGSFYPGHRGNRRISVRETLLLAQTISFVGTIAVVNLPLIQDPKPCQAAKRALAILHH